MKIASALPDRVFWCTLWDVIWDAEQPDATTTAYLREVRKLRSRHRTHPARLSEALADLNRTRRPRPTTQVRRVQAPRTPDRPTPPAPKPLLTGQSGAFAAEVESALRSDGGSLRFTRRSRLLARAERLGVSRFDANLIIASVLHHHRPTRTSPTPSAVTPLLWLCALALVWLVSIQLLG